MIRAMTRFCVAMVKKYLPDPFVLAILLTFVTFIGGVTLAKATPLEMVVHWGNGLTSLLSFTMQMVMMLVTGHALANSSQVKGLLKTLAKIPKNPASAITLTAVVAFIASYLNWGFGLVVGALFAKQVAAVNKGIHYPLLIAAAYSGNIIRGPSSSIPLVVATKGHFLEKAIGLVPVTQTLYSYWNLVISFALLIALPLVARLMIPPAQETIEVDPERLREDEVSHSGKSVKELTPAVRLENSRWISLVIGIGGLIFLFRHFYLSRTLNIDLNIVALLFLFVGILLHGTPMNYKDAINNAVKATGGIVLQFPFYAGMMGMMSSSGLGKIIAEWFVSSCTAASYPLVTFWSAGLLNIFIPSGGGQWAVQGPIAVEAAKKLGADLPRSIMAVAWGDSWTNQIQPFWALPILAIAGLDARDIMGYCVMFTIVAGIIISLGLYFL